MTKPNYHWPLGKRTYVFQYLKYADRSNKIRTHVHEQDLKKREYTDKELWAFARVLMARHGWYDVVAVYRMPALEVTIDPNFREAIEKVLAKKGPLPTIAVVRHLQEKKIPGHSSVYFDRSVQKVMKKLSHRTGNGAYVLGRKPTSKGRGSRVKIPQ